MPAKTVNAVRAVEGLQVDLLDALDDLHAVRQSWERVYDTDPDSHYFLAWNWIYNWLASTKQRWLTLAVRDDESYIAFLPLRLSTKLGIDGGFRHSLRMAGSYYAGYTGFICDPKAEASAIAALGQALQQLNWNELHLDDLFPSERRRQLLFDTFSETEFVIAQKPRPPHLTADQVIDHDIYAIIPLESDWETFLRRRMGAHTRYNAKSALSRVETDSEFRLSIADRESIEQDLEALLQLWGARWAPKNALYANYIAQNTRNMIHRCFADGSIFVPVLWKGSDRIAVTLNFADRRTGRLIQFLAGRDRNVKRPPPGFALNLFTIRWAIANGFKIYDFGTGNFAYKYDFGAQDILVQRFLIATRSGANLHGQVDTRTLEPALAEVARAYEARQLSSAEQGCRAILAFDPGCAPMSDLLDDIARQKTAAAALLAEAMKRHGGGQIDEATRYYEKVLEIDSTNVEAHEKMGLIHFRRRSFELAEKSLRKAADLNGNSARAFNNLGSALAGLGKLSEALECFSRAASIDPDYAVALENVANTKITIERHQRRVG